MWYALERCETRVLWGEQLCASVRFAALLLDAALQKQLSEIKRTSIKEAVAARYAKFRNMAQFFAGEA